MVAADGVTLARGGRLTDLRVLSRTRGAVNKTRPWLVLTMAGDGRTRFEDNPRDETVSPSSARASVTDARREDWRGPRNSIEEFDPGSA